MGLTSLGAAGEGSRVAAAAGARAEAEAAPCGDRAPGLEAAEEPVPLRPVGLERRAGEERGDGGDRNVRIRRLERFHKDDTAVTI